MAVLTSNLNIVVVRQEIDGTKIDTKLCGKR